MNLTANVINVLINKPNEQWTNGSGILKIRNGRIYYVEDGKDAGIPIENVFWKRIDGDDND